MEFNGIRYEILYSNQLNKKNKTWKDGFMTFFPKGSKAYLYDENNKHIDSLYGIRINPELDEEMKFDKHIVLPQAVLQNNTNFNTDQIQEKQANKIENETIIDNEIPKLRKTIQKKENNKLFSKTRSISQLLSLFSSPQTQIKINNLNNNNNFVSMEMEIDNHNANNNANDNNGHFNNNNNNNNNNLRNVNNKFDSNIETETFQNCLITMTINNNNNNNNNDNNNNNYYNNRNNDNDEQNNQNIINSSINIIKDTKHNVSNINDTNLYKNDSFSKYDTIYNTHIDNTKNIKNINSTQNISDIHVNKYDNIKNNKSSISKINSTNRANSYNNTSHNITNNIDNRNKLKENDISKYELHFPSSEECFGFNDTNLIRNSVIPINFTNVSSYQESFRKAILENIQIELSKLAIKYRSMPSLNENAYRSNGINFYMDCILTRFQPTFLKFKKKNNNCNYLLTIAKKEKSSAYSKDDIWIISINKNFEKNTTFLAKSIFYGPNGNSAVEVMPISKTDIEVSKYITLNNKPVFHVYAIRSININTEEIILNNLKVNISKSSVLPYLLNYSNTIKKRNDKTRFNSPSMASLINENKINELDEFLNDIIIQYKLNEDQEAVLRTFVESLKSSSKSPITLVHGVFGAGKSLLISIIIFFLYRSYIFGYINPKSNFKILVSSMTNVAVDRILLYLMEKFDFKNFVRVGSLKKIAKPLLPYAAQISKGNEDIDELNSLLKCEELSPTEVKYIQETIKKFKKNENRNNIHQSFLIASTCIASSFDILDHTKVPIVILDECSQFIEPLSLLPICRFQSEKLLLVGDPKQLSPTITTNSAYDKDPVNKGLDRTLFERLALDQCNPILLRTQYRCHPIISNISNSLFYENRLIDGRKPELPVELLNDKFPILCFVDVNSTGRSQYSSFINTLEADFIVRSIEKLVENGVKGEDIGVISLYKGQADLIKNRFYANPLDKIKMIQVSTVDAFQGAEKSIIFLSIVKSNSSEFIDSDRRVNVAITRAKNHLILVGNKTNLIKFSVIWKSIITNHCQKAENGILKPEEFYNLI